MRLEEPNVLEKLFEHGGEVYGHILQQIFLNLDGATLRTLRSVSRSMQMFVDKRIWGNSRASGVLYKRLMDGWHGRLSSPSRESAFQCSDEVYDIKICNDSIICGLRNGTIEIWNRKTLTKEMELTEQQGEVQVEANEDIVVGISTDSTVCVWNRRSGKIKDVFFHHRASVYGVALLPDGSVATGSMDGTISIIDGRTMTVKKHFMAHDEDGWGVSDLEASENELYSGSLSGHIRSWSLPTCSLLLDIDAGHAVNCISVHDGIMASCSRTGKQRPRGSNVTLWDASTGLPLRTIDLPSACYVKLDRDKLLTLVAAGSAIMGEPHMIKWPIAKIMILQRPRGGPTATGGARSRAKGAIEELRNWDHAKQKSEILIRYQRTPAVTCNRTMLVYSQPRTKGMCSVIKHWT